MRESTLPLPKLRQGKVRDVYEVAEDRVLLVATDRVSAFDVVMRETVPHKGAVLTQLTAWWLRYLESDVPHHMITTDVAEIIDLIPTLAPHRRDIAGRAMLCRRTDVFPVECVVRGYLAGSAWAEYRASGSLAGESMPSGLGESDRLDPPLFSPATKAEEGHDENITFPRMVAAIGNTAAGRLRDLSLMVYSRGRDLAARRGIIVADTKFEFGRVPAGKGGHAEVILVDEVLTPDSSRFWPADRYMPGKSQPSFDKQPLRDFLASEKAGGRWNGESPPPPLPADVVSATSERYLDVYQRLTGSSLTIQSFE